MKEIRIDHLLEDCFYTPVSRDTAGRLRYDFSRLDRVVQDEVIAPTASFAGPVNLPPNSVTLLTLPRRAGAGYGSSTRCAQRGDRERGRADGGLHV